MKTVRFVTPKAISEMDITTIGGSDKRNDDSKIGQFCSGLKYALALFLRNGVECTITSKINNETKHYNFYKQDIKDPSTHKEKTVIGIEVNTFDSSSLNDEKKHITSAFAYDLGYDWKLEYGLREIWSNMIDENGYVVHNDDELEIDDIEYTVITLNFEEESEFNTIWENRNTLFITDNDTPLYVFTRFNKTVKVYKNTDDEIGRIYKQGINIFQEEKYPSYNRLKQKNRYRFSVNFGDLDERRIVCDHNTLIHEVFYTIVNAENSTEVNEFLFQDGSGDDFSMMKNTYHSALNPTESIIAYLRENPDVPIPSFLKESLEKLEDTPLNNRRISTFNSSIYDLKKEVRVEESSQQIKKKPSNDCLTDKIQTRIPFEIKFPIKEAFIQGSVVVADNFNKTILVTDDFDHENDDHIIDFIIQHFNLVDGKENTFRKIIRLLIK